MNKRVVIIAAAAVALGGGYEAYSTVTAKPAPKPKVAGTVYVLSKEFVLNLSDRRYAKVDVALVLAPDQSTGAGGEGAATPPDGYGTLPEEAVVRDIITNEITNRPSASLIDPGSRERIKHEILAVIRAKTDIKIDDVLFTDVAVQ